jgi:hypothetical protein
MREVTNLEQCSILGASMGYTFSVVELRDAHGKEWGMRRFHFARQVAPTRLARRGPT